jgi:hypothetical protein
VQASGLLPETTNVASVSVSVNPGDLHIDHRATRAFTERAHLDSRTTFMDLVELGLIQRVAAGELPHTAVVSFDHPAAPAALIDDRFTVTRSAESDVAIAVLAEAENAVWAVKVHGTSTVLRVAAPTQHEVRTLADELATRVTRPRTTQTPVRIWNGSAIGASAKNDRAIDAPAWDEIARNYPAQARDQLGELLRLNRPVGLGKLILWHGEPGTGKTTAARSLFRSGAEWCAVEYVTDPERFLADPSYITEVISRPPLRSERPTFDHVDDHETSWRLIVAEDADEHLRAGPGPQKFLGQGVNSLILLTTNEPLDKLHPALVRPGRALARIEFTRFNAAEASKWLGGTDQHRREVQAGDRHSAHCSLSILGHFRLGLPFECLHQEPAHITYRKQRLNRIRRDLAVCQLLNSDPQLCHLE